MLPDKASKFTFVLSNAENQNKKYDVFTEPLPVFKQIDP